MVQMGDTSGDQWNGMADAYQKLTTETSSRPIGVMLERSNSLLPFSQATGVLDNGCGPGPVMSGLLQDYEIPESCSLLCADFSDGMIKQVEQKKDRLVEADGDSPWKRVKTVVENAMDLQSIESSSQSHVTAGWVYFMTPDPQKCLSESKRVLKEGGVLSCSSWQGSQWLELMYLLPKIRPDKSLPELPKEWIDVNLMKGELEKAGFKDVESHQVITTMKYEKLDDMVDVFLTKMPHMLMMTNDMSEDEIARYRMLMLEEGRKMCPSSPAELTGTALIAVGRK